MHEVTDLEQLESYKDYLKSQSKEQLIVFLVNQKYIEKELRDRLFLLTGCSDFGNSDGMNGTCVECSVNNEQQWRRCCLFRKMYHDYRAIKQNNVR